ncbi:tetratricopeptide repeat protein [Limnoglobus roseus]|uniref:Beta-barrel assembly-enhancing protease n=1 Tax=Limnoglobus roseus TaxID=2598579 RepID=A0A5C1A4P0_9BACT|nr:tetratricopeptide repeat protein [Limnoglobus roseus]QEL14081.1 Beta-barrel assembly-enhancing protease [Limnoglobus roseus]
MNARRFRTITAAGFSVLVVTTAIWTAASRPVPVSQPTSAATTPSVPAAVAVAPSVPAAVAVAPSVPTATAAATPPAPPAPIATAEKPPAPTVTAAVTPPVPVATAEKQPEDKPIPVRPETGPYRPYQFLLSTEQSIEIYKQRIKRDVQDHMSRSTLGGLYLRQAKETGDHSAYDRADEMFAEAVKLSPSYDQAQIGRIAVANARHQFADARKRADALYRENPDSPSAIEALVMLADANVELGRYDETDVNLKELVAKGGDPTPPAFLARMSRMAELRGDIEKALKFLKQAEDGDREDEALPVSLAWYPSRRGEILLSQGKADEAATAFESAIRSNPVSPDLKIMLAKARMAQGRPKDAVAVMEDVLKVDQDIDTWLPFGHYLLAVGEKDRAEEQFKAADKKADAAEPTAVRELILHYCDLGRRLPRALELAKREMTTRKDVFSCDSYAWALFKNGKADEAEKAADDALRLGTRDATLLFHAGVIAHKLGKKDRAKELLEKALAINPTFSVEQAAEAKKLLGK